MSVVEQGKLEARHQKRHDHLEFQFDRELKDLENDQDDPETASTGAPVQVQPGAVAVAGIQRSMSESSLTLVVGDEEMEG